MAGKGAFEHIPLLGTQAHLMNLSPTFLGIYNIELPQLLPIPVLVRTKGLECEWDRD